MLSRELIILIEAVRNLKMQVVLKDDKEMIKVPGSTDAFPKKLVLLQKALEAYEKSEASEFQKPSMGLKPKFGASLSAAQNKYRRHKEKAFKRARDRIQAEMLEDERDPGPLTPSP